MTVHHTPRPEVFMVVIVSKTENRRTPHSDDPEYVLLCNQQGHAQSHEQMLALIANLHNTMANVSDEEISDYNAFSDAKERERLRMDQESFRIPKVRMRKGYVYIVQGDTYYKIGYTKNPAGRLKPLDVLSPFPLQVKMLIPSDDIEALEASLHRRFAGQRIRGEWFSLTEQDIEALRLDYKTVDHSNFNAG